MQLTTIKQQHSPNNLVHTSYYVSDKEYSTPEIIAEIFDLNDEDYSIDEEAYIRDDTYFKLCRVPRTQTYLPYSSLVWVHRTRAITEYQYQVLEELISIRYA